MATLDSNDRSIDKNKALSLYRSLLYPRRIERRMLRLLRQNKISKWFSGIGQEAIAVGTPHGLQTHDYILPMHRNLGVFTTRNVPLYELFCQLLEKKDGFTRGRDRTFHFGSLNHHIVGMISHLAANLPVGNGLALAAKLRSKDQVAVCFCGEGATSEGDFHEALNLAAVWRLPVIFLIENNGYGLSTPTEEQYACEHLADRAFGYGIEGTIIDGNNIFEVMKATEKAREHVLQEGPMLIEAKTFRQRGHEEASGTWYVPDDTLAKWKEKDPLRLYEQWLTDQKYIEESEEFDEIESTIDQQIESALQQALKAPSPSFDPGKEERNVYAQQSSITPRTAVKTKQSDESSDYSEKRFIDGIQLALDQAFEDDDKFLLMGQDIAEYGGVFKVTKGFLEKFGSSRIRNTPIMESGIIGAALGLALEGYNPVVEMQFSDFISCGFNQLINNVGKGQWRWMPPLNITIRGPHGAGVGAGPFHSASPEGWFMQHPGLKIVVPATVRDAQQLTYTSLLDPNPVLLLEHKKLYRSLKSKTPDSCPYTSLGDAAVRHEGGDAVIITYGLGVHWALDALEKMEQPNIQILDLRCLQPIDYEAIRDSVSETNKVLLLQEPSRRLGPMSEIARYISQECFEYLDAPLMSCSSLNTPVPASDVLEEGYLANSRLIDKMEKLLDY